MPFYGQVSNPRKLAQPLSSANASKCCVRCQLRDYLTRDVIFLVWEMTIGPGPISAGNHEFVVCWSIFLWIRATHGNLQPWSRCAGTVC